MTENIVANFVLSLGLRMAVKLLIEHFVLAILRYLSIYTL